MTSKCLHCREKLNNLINLGDIPIVNNFSKSNNSKKINTKIGICKNCKLFQHQNIVDKNKIFNKNYPYISSSSKFLKQHFNDISKKIDTNGKNFIVEIGSNDGSFLENFKKRDIRHLGIDPSSLACKEAKKKNINYINDFFSTKISKRIIKKYGQADIIFSANTLAHVENLNDVLSGINLLLNKDGILIIENIYLRTLLKKNLFDQLYHEHLYTYSIEAINNIFSKYDLFINDIEFNKMQGGSFLIKLSRKKKNINYIKKLIKKENNNILIAKKTRLIINNKINNSLKAISLFIKKIRSKNLKITGYGASAKCVMLINLLNLTKNEISFIVDNTKYKQNMLIPGTNIPVIAPKKSNNYLKEFCIIFAWNFKDEIIKKEKFINKKTIWVLPMPKIKIIN